MNMRHLRGWTATAAIVCLVSTTPAQAGERLARLSAIFDREPQPAAAPKSRPLGSAMNWWSIPRPARQAAKQMAAQQDASVTRCIATESGDQVTYSIFAARRTGLFQKSEFELTSVSEPSAVARKREQAQTMESRMDRLKARMHIGSFAAKTRGNQPLR